jgi:phytoene synthase
MPDALSEIGELARAREPDRFLCALFAPADRREALFALIAYHHELGRAAEVASNPLIAAIRLQWWRDALDEPRRHEVATPLRHAMAAGLLAREDLLAMADAREAELDEEGIPSRAAFAAYLRGSHGGFAVAAGRLLGAAAPELVTLQAIGAAQGLAALLRNSEALAARGRCLLPRDALAGLGLTPHEAIAAPQRMAPLLAELAGQGAPPSPRAWPPGLLAAALPAVLARRDLRALAAGRPARRGTSDRLALVWAAWRRRA